MGSRDVKSAILLTVFASLVWGTSFPGAKLGLDFAGNDILFLWLRFVVATALTLTAVLVFKKIRLEIFKEPVIWLIGALNAAGFTLQYVGLNYTNASKTALLVDINVVAVAVISYFAFKERLGRVQSLGIACGVAGTFLLTLNKELRFDQAELLGDVLVYTAGWSWAFFIVLNKKMVVRYTGIEISSAAIASCALWLAAPTAYLYLTGNGDFSMQPLAWVGIVYLGVACTSIATLLWAMGLEGVSATASATIMLLEVITALIISFSPLLNESLSLAAAVGAVLVMLSIYLVAGTGLGEKEELKSS